MKVIITESQYKKILLEQTSTDKNCKVWVDSKDDPKYKRYLIENRVYWSGRNLAKKNLIGIMGYQDSDYDYYSTEFVAEKPWFAFDKIKDKWFEERSIYNKIEKDNPKIEKHRQECRKLFINNIRLYGIKPKSLGFNDLMIVAYKKPDKVCIKPTTITQSLPTPVQPPKAAPPKAVSPPSTLDKTKPVDFYFGNRILRAPDYEIAKKFAEKLAIRNFNSNMIKIYEHPDNERWFVGQNDKIYLNYDLYNQDPNKNVYIDPIKMGMVSI